MDREEIALRAHAWWVVASLRLFQSISARSFGIRESSSLYAAETIIFAQTIDQNLFFR